MTDEPTAAADGSDSVGGLGLTAPGPVASIEPASAEHEVTIGPEVVSRVDAVVAGFIDAVAAAAVHGADYRRRIDDIDSLAYREIRATSAMSERFLDRPMQAAELRGGGNLAVAQRLVDLRRAVEELNPAAYDLHRGPRRLLGIIPTGDPVAAYFDRYKKARPQIQRLVGELGDGGAELAKDNAAIGQEQTSLWTQVETLRQYAYLAQRLDTALEAHIDDLATTDPDRARALRTDLLFAVRQRRQDILTQLAVAKQGFAALRIVAASNRELTRAINAATTTTLAALRTAIMVAQAMAGADADLAALQRSWDQVFATFAQIDAFKAQVVISMNATVNELSDQVERSRSQDDGSSVDDGAATVSSPGSGLQLP